MLPLPRAILFDLDNTIIAGGGRPEASWLAVLEARAASVAPLAPARVAAAIQAISRGFFAAPEAYRTWRFRLAEARHEIVRQAFARLAAEEGAVLAPEIALEIADACGALRDAELRLLPGAGETLDELRRLGVLLALVTNGASAIQRAKIQRFDLARRFHHLQIEGDHGFGKPEERAYTHAMAALGVAAGETWMVGDNLEWEVVAPQRLGIHAVWHDIHGQGLPAGCLIRPDRIIRGVPELLEY